MNKASEREKDLALLKQMADRAHELLAEFDNLTPDERKYAADLVVELRHLVELFKRKLPPSR